MRQMFTVTGQSVMGFDAAGNHTLIAINGGNVVDMRAALQ